MQLAREVAYEIEMGFDRDGRIYATALLSLRDLDLAVAETDRLLEAGARVLGFNYDTGERYLSIEGFLPAA